MKSLQRIALALGFSAGLFFPTAVNAQAPTPERLKVLMAFAAEGLGVSSIEVPPPRIVYMSFENLQISHYGIERTSGVSNKAEHFFSVLALYSFDAREMRLIEDIDYSRPEHEWVVVHELAHYFQQVYHKLYLNKVRCIQDLEATAYRISNMWAIVTGHGHTTGGLFTSCDDD